MAGRCTQRGPRAAQPLARCGWVDGVWWCLGVWLVVFGGWVDGVCLACSLQVGGTDKLPQDFTKPRNFVDDEQVRELHME